LLITLCTVEFDLGDELKSKITFATTRRCACLPLTPIYFTAEPEAKPSRKKKNNLRIKLECFSWSCGHCCTNLNRKLVILFPKPSPKHEVRNVLLVAQPLFFTLHCSITNIGTYQIFFGPFTRHIQSRHGCVRCNSFLARANELCARRAFLTGSPTAAKCGSG
jgi:hypothetical protein